jgi:hypothetical protein
MSGLFGQSEKVNNVLFVGILILFIGVLINIRFDSLFFFLFLLFFSSVIFGYVSKSPNKSFLLGFLVWVVFPLSKIVDILRQNISVSDINLIYGSTTIMFLVFFIYFINGIISGGAGYFTAANHPDKERRIIYPLVLFLITIGLFLVSILIAFALSF